MMKLLNYLILISNIAWAGINPAETVTPLYYVFDKVKVKDSGVHVKGPKVRGKKSKYLSQKGSKFVKSHDEYNRDVRISSPVFKVEILLKNRRNQVPIRDYHGSAFLVGDNYLLTARHLFNKKCLEKSECDIELKISLNKPFRGSVEMEDITYCDKKYDFCLIETEDFQGKKLGESIEPTRLNYGYLPNNLDKEILTAIGNSKGWGIQLARGKKVTLAEFVSLGKDKNVAIRRLPDQTNFEKASIFLHNAPIFNGNSGGPLLNSHGEVIGINIAGEDSVELDKEKNAALSLKVVEKKLREELDPEVFQKLNFISR